MTRERFNELLNSVTVRDVAGGKHYNAGIFIEGMTREELSELATLAGAKLRAIPAKSRFNPEWLERGPRANWTLIWHRDALRRVRS